MLPLLLALAAADPTRFAAMCIPPPSLAPKEVEALARRCALHVCSLQLTTAPAEPPLVLVSGLADHHLKMIARAGSERRGRRRSTSRLWRSEDISSKPTTQHAKPVARHCT